MLGILDYNAGNQTSVRRALDALAIPATITNDPAVLRTCKGILFPGVGAAGSAMHELTKRGLDTYLRWAAANAQPILGICLGCQILLDYSEENDTHLLGLCPGRSTRFPKNGHQEDGSQAPVPHMGWNTLRQKKDCCLFHKLPETAFFYFVHSYYVTPDPTLVLATTTYTHEFCSVFGRDGLWGVQFHPEKSGNAGLQLLRNFYDYAVRTQHAL